MPFAFGVDEPVMVQACGTRHIVRAGLDPAGQLRQNHHKEPIEETEPGTIIRLALPNDAFHWVDVGRWVKAFALFNPHAEIHFSENGKSSKHGNHSASKTSISYHPTVNFLNGWRKFLPTDNTSPWWYDENALARLIFAHIAHARHHDGPDIHLRDFVRQFRGLTNRSQAKLVCDRFPEINRLSDFEDLEGRIGDLLSAMKEVVQTQPRPALLGFIGKDHFERCFTQWGRRCLRLWYRRVEQTHEGLPYFVEVAVAETQESCGAVFTGVNFSPTFDDPLTGTELVCQKFRSFGFSGFLERAHALPNCDDDQPVTTAAALHIVCPHLSIQDKGKTRVDLPDAIVDCIGDMLWKVIKNLYREGERRRRDAAKQERADEERQRGNGERMALNQAVELVMAEAVNKATGNGTFPVSAHTLFYSVRPLVQQYNADRQLKSSYFEQDLLPAYQRKHGAIPGLYYEARGTLYEPHTGLTVALGTREVSDYRFPSWLYDKILYIEKQGLWPVFEQARLAERFDMAIVAGEGYATEACRVLFAHAEKGRRFKLAVLHDSDPYGYNIARTLRAETARMPGYKVEVVDIGLKLAQALEMGLQTETYTRKKALPGGLELTTLEQEYFVGRRSGELWIAQRVELNALDGPAMIEYAVQRLETAGFRTKVVPDNDSLPALARELYLAEAGKEIDTLLNDLLQREAMVQELATQLADKAKLGGARNWILQALKRDDRLSWRAALQERLRDMLERQTGLRDMVRQRAARYLAAT
jgi:hypothetical protein